MPVPLDPTASVQGLMDLARARAQAGDTAGAARTWQAAVHLAETHELHGLLAVIEARIAEVDVRARRLELARERLDAAWDRIRARNVPAATRAEVGGRLGQVLVFQGEVATGVALMQDAAAAWREAGEETTAHELDLAVAAVCERVDRAVDEAGVEPGPRAEALARRARVKSALGMTAEAAEDLGKAWAMAARLEPGRRGRIGLLYGGALLERGAPDAALAVVRVARAALEAAGDAHGLAAADALLARLPGATA
jgi:tetratricopeptide (TPR) repeat protein